MSEPLDTRPLEPVEPSTEIERVAPDPALLTSASIVVVSGRTAGKIYPLLGPELIIGRGAVAHIRIDEKAVSTRHAKISRGPGGHVLVDLGSTNGTFLNAKALAPNQPTDLMPGDSIQVAETVLAYLPAGARNPQEQTQYLSKLIPQVPGSMALRLGSAGTLPDAQILARLLQGQAAEPEPPAPTLEERIESIMRVLRMVRKHWLLVFALVALGALAGDARVLVRPPLAEAAFRMRITPSVVNEQLKPYDRDNRGFYTAVEQSFMSQELVEKTLAAMGHKNITGPHVDSVMKTLTFDSVAFMTFEGKYQNRDPEYATKFLSRHVEGYLAGEVTKAIRVAQAEVDFLSSRVKEREDDLRKTELAMKEFKSKHLESLPEFSSGHISSREALFSRRAELSAQLTKSNLELAAARKRLAEGAPLLASKVAGAAPYEANLVDVRRKLSEARAKGLGDQHAEVAALIRQEADLERLAQEARQKDPSALERGANTGLNDLKNRVSDLEVAARGTGAELGEVNAQLSRLDNIVGTMPEVEARYAELTRSYNANKELHTKLYEDLRTAQLNLDMERTSARARFEVIAPPESTGVPLRKALLKGAGMGAAVGLVLAALVIAILEFRAFLKARKSPSTAIVPVGGVQKWPS
jgi:uncharacterized protein involved in exopolysaccharide biosynthesis